jgi:hypothetical protein
MKISIPATVRPFDVPSFAAVSIEGDTKEATAMPLATLDGKTLAKLCDDFRDSIFAKAGKEQPPEPARADASRRVKASQIEALLMGNGHPADGFHVAFLEQDVPALTSAILRLVNP